MFYIYLFNKFVFKIWKAHEIYKFFWTQKYQIFVDF